MRHCHGKLIYMYCQTEKCLITQHIRQQSLISDKRYIRRCWKSSLGIRWNYDKYTGQTQMKEVNTYEATVFE